MAGAGISTMCMLHSTLQAVLETVGSAFSHVEVVCEGNHTDLEVLESYDFTVSFHAPFSDLNLASLNRKIQEESIRQISDNIEKASIYNAESVCIHPGHISPMGFHFMDKVTATHTESLRTLAEKAEECAIFLGLENMPMFSILCGRTPSEVETLINEVDSEYLRLTFDIGHAHTAGALSQFLRLKEKMSIIHVHDNDGNQDIHLPLGEGTIDLSILKELKDKRKVIEVYTYADALKTLQVLKDL